MGLFNKIKSFFAFTFNDKPTGSSASGKNTQSVKSESTDTDPGRMKMASDVSALDFPSPPLQGSTTNLQSIFDNEPVKKIPRDQNVTPISVMAGLVLNPAQDSIDGYNLVNVTDTGAISVDIGGATITAGNLNVQLDATGSPADSVLIYGATSANVPEKLLTVSRRLQVDASLTGAGNVSDDEDGSVVAGQSGILLNLDLLYGYNGATWERIKATSNRLVVDGSQVTQPISAVSLPLPTGAATETTLSSVKTQTDKLSFTATRLLVDGSGVTQPISGTVAVTQSTSPWVVSGTVTANIGTTAGLALDSSLSTINTTLGSPFQAGGSIGNTTFASTQSGTWNINNISGTISLPTGASTSAKQDTGNTSLASIDGKLNSLGQKSMAASVPVVISSDQSTVNTDPQDRVARELGRVLASDALYVSETFSLTSNVFANARPVNGDMNVRHYKTKKIYIKNTSAFQGRYTIIGSVDNGTTFDVTIAADTAINTGVTSITDLTDAVTHIQIQVRSNNGAQTTTYVTKAYALGV